MHRKAGAVLIIFVVAISSVAAVVYYYDARAKAEANPYPGSEAVHHSLKDLWYPPEGGYNIFPLMITAISSGRMLYW